MSYSGFADEDTKKPKKGSQVKDKLGKCKICRLTSPKFYQLTMNDIPLIICLPFAYLRTILIKIGLVRKGATPCTELLTFMLIGIPLLLAYQVYDLVDFIKWSSHMEDPNEKADKFHIQKAHFMLFYKLLQGMDQMKEPISARALI